MSVLYLISLKNWRLLCIYEGGKCSKHIYRFTMLVEQLNYINYMLIKSKAICISKLQNSDGNMIVKKTMKNLSLEQPRVHHLSVIH
jgi:uncharacterized membrane protein YgaE (UPF0421/DUF939 family)